MTIYDTIIDLSKYVDPSDNSLYDTDPSMESLTVDCASVDVIAAYGAPESPIGCASTKYSGDSINLEAAPSGAIGPYHVRFWRMPNASYAMAYGEVGSVRTITEGSSTSTSFSLVDSDLVAASGSTTAGTPTTGATGAIADPVNSGAPLAAGYISVATTVYDSCPTGAMSCVTYCDVALGCIAPTCNFTVT